jgi:hypothetical protein
MKTAPALLLCLALAACAAPPRPDDAPAARSIPTGVTLGGTIGSFYSNTTSR